jgi:hypothetical protein
MAFSSGKRLEKAISAIYNIGGKTVSVQRSRLPVLGDLSPMTLMIPGSNQW